MRGGLVPHMTKSKGQSERPPPSALLLPVCSRLKDGDKNEVSGKQLQEKTGTQNELKPTDGISLSTDTARQSDANGQIRDLWRF